MDVVIFYKSYKKYGGQEKVVYNLSNYLGSKGYNVTVYASKIKDLPESENVSLKKIFIPPLPRGARTLLFAFLSYRKAKKIKKQSVDTVILGFGKTFYQDIYRSGGGVHKYYFQRALLKYSNPIQRKLYKIKKYLSLSHWINIWIEEKTFENSHLKSVIVPSEFVKNQILSVFNDFDDKKIRLIRNDVNIERFDYTKRDVNGVALRNEMNISVSEAVFSFVSTNHRLKGLEYLLKACFILKQKEYAFKLIIAGNGNASYFERIIDKYGLSEHAKWMGTVKDVENVYYASDFLVYPTLFDTFGLVVLESMACGAPVFCSKYAGASEIIRDREFIIDNPQNDKEIAEKMIFALNNRNLWHTWREAAVNTAKKYSTNTSSAEIAKTINDIK